MSNSGASIERDMRLVPLFSAMLAAVSALCPASAQARVKSNTQERAPDNVFIADVNGDQSADFLEVNGSKIVARKSTFQFPVVFDDILADGNKIVKVFTGDFVPAGRRERGKDQVCAVFADGGMNCWAISDDNTAMWWWFSQGSIVASNEEAMVGDFNGDGQDDV